MRISEWELEKEIDILISAAMSSGSNESARRFLIKAENKLYGYDDIPDSVMQRMKDKINMARKELNI